MSLPQFVTNDIVIGLGQVLNYYLGIRCTAVSVGSEEHHPLLTWGSEISFQSTGIVSRPSGCDTKLNEIIIQVAEGFLRKTFCVKCV